MLFAGVDIGSVTTKAVLIDGSNRVLAFTRLPTSYNRQQSGEDIMAKVLAEAGKSASDINFTVATGYGRRAYTGANDTVPEIIAHARGTAALFPQARTIIDIGGQDSKVIEIDEAGRPLRFTMNDKCAAGTGRFLEVMAGILGLKLDELGPVSLTAGNPCTLTSVCTVFAESEIISLLSENKRKEDIAYGLHQAIARRVVNMGTSSQIKYREPIVFSGGVARNAGVVKALEEVLKKTVLSPPEPQITAALGAALIAREKQRAA